MVYDGAAVTIKACGYKVFERDADRSIRQQGATLDLHADSGLKALRVAGLLDEFKKHYRPGADKMRVVNQHAIFSLKTTIPKPMTLTMRGFVRKWTVARRGIC